MNSFDNQRKFDENKVKTNVACHASEASNQSIPSLPLPHEYLGRLFVEIESSTSKQTF